MQKRKGFTLVELVVVIAVIAILAGVLIGTFASVINRANESARVQEVKQQEIAQKADDLIKKIDNSNWFGWEDFEKSIVDKITSVIDDASKEDDIATAVVESAASKAVTETLNKYYAEHAMGNTGLTEDQVKAIVENALGTFKYEGVSAEQVTTIVNNAVSKMTTGLTAAQVQKIVNAAADKVEAGQLTSAQITTIVANAVASNKEGLARTTDVENAVNTVVNNITNAQASQLTASDVENIISAAVKAAGTTAWVTSETYATEKTFTLETAEDVKGLATLVNGGYDFAKKVITLPTDTIDLSSGNWTPIGNSQATEFNGTLIGTVDTNGVPTTVIEGLTLDEQFNAIKEAYLVDCKGTGNNDKVGVGFVAYLGKDAVLKNITFTKVSIHIKDKQVDSVMVGTAVGYLDGGRIENVHVESGTIESTYMVGGLVGAACGGEIVNCSVGTSTSKVALISTENDAHASVGGLIGYWRDFSHENVPLADKDNLVVDNVQVYVTYSAKESAKKGNLFGRINTFNNYKGLYLNGKLMDANLNQQGGNFTFAGFTGTDVDGQSTVSLIGDKWVVQE